MKFWFVNLNKYYNEQRNGGYLWAPLKNETGKTEKYWETLQNVNVGDIIFCNKGGMIQSIAIVEKGPYLSEIPNEFRQFWKPEGRKLEVKFIDLENPFRFKDYKDYILENINKDECPFNIKGSAKQAYLIPFDEKIAKFFINKINSKAINELLSFVKYENEIKVDEYLEELEQFEKINSGLIVEYSDEELKKIDNKKYVYVAKFGNTENKVLRGPADDRLKATRMKKAKYLCEVDSSHKTFMNSSGKHQYLESHHIIPMKAQKDYINTKLDSMFNLIALCPTCHAKVHYATLEEKKEIFYKMYSIRKDDMIAHGFDLDKIDYVFDKYYKK